MKYLTLIVSMFAFILITGCSSSPADRGAQTITGESLMTHIETLASDEFEGRGTATRGEDLTVQYLVDQLQAMGVEPGVSDSSFIQEFPLLGQRVDGESAEMTIRRGGRVAENLDYNSDFMAWPSNESENVEIERAEVLYVGYGIQAPEFEWDDYKGADVEGKILVFKNSDPSGDPDLFDGDSRLYYGRWSYKFEKAAEMGALGAIIIHTTPTAGYGWDVVANSWGRERFSLPSDGDPSENPEFNSWLTEEGSRSLFEAAGLSLDEMLDRAESRDFEPVPLEGVTMDVSLDATYSDLSSRNVVGMIQGNDPDLMDEYVVFTAHYDHLGITTPVNGDSINNGARDNAAGVSAVLNLADAFKEVEPEMRRSAIFLFVGAEEMGLLGSLYWANNPTVHPGSVSANLNMDGMQVYGPTEDIVLVGYERNTITDVIREFAEAEDRTVKPDPNPGQGYFYRSDHFSMARVGIPAVFPRRGNEYIGKPEGWSATVDSVDAANYHSVTDEINQYWDVSGMVDDVRLFFRASLHIINADEMMEWYPGDEFEAVRMEMLEDAE
ncbi:MAG: M28 family peptidase [Balneolaceae bacterium]|nr:M28 family peptidase [Balneolaceae bacterium]